MNPAEEKKASIPNEFKAAGDEGGIKAFLLGALAVLGGLGGYIATAIGKEVKREDENSPPITDLKDNNKVSNEDQLIKRTFT